MKLQPFSPLKATFIAGALALLLIGAVFLFCFPKYDTNDDVFVTLFASGKLLFQDRPSEYLAIQNVAIGLILKLLYTKFPGMPWYSVYIYSAYFLGMAFAAYVVLKTHSSRITLASFFAAYLGYSWEFLNNPQFTVASALLALGAFMLFISSFASAGKGVARKERGLAIGGLIFAGLIRIQSFYLILVLFGPVMVSVFLYLRGWARYRFALTLALVCAICVGTDRLDAVYYALTPEWGHFREIRLMIATGFDFGLIKNDPSVLASVGWTVNDLDLFYRCFYLDPEIYSLRNILKLMEWFPRTFAVGEKDLSQALRLVTPETIACLFLGLGISRQTERRNAVFCSLLASAVLVALSVAGRPAPWRVILPIQVCLALIPFVRVGIDFGGRSIGPQRPRAWKVIVALLLASVLGLGGSEWWRQYQRSSAAQARSAAYRSWIDSLQPDSKRLFVAWANMFLYEDYVLPFREFRRHDKLRLFTVSHHGLMPLAHDVLREQGLSDIREGLLQGDNSLLISSPEWIPGLEKYYLEKRKVYVKFVEVSRFGETGAFRPVLVPPRSSADLSITRTQQGLIGR